MLHRQGPQLQQQLGAQPLQTQSHLQGQGQVHSQHPQQQQQGAPQQQGGAQPQQLQPQHLQGMPPIGAQASNGVPASSAPPASSAQMQSLQSPVRSGPHHSFLPQYMLMRHNSWITD